MRSGLYSHRAGFGPDGIGHFGFGSDSEGIVSFTIQSSAQRSSRHGVQRSPKIEKKESGGKVPRDVESYQHGITSAKRHDTRFIDPPLEAVRTAS